MFTLLRSVRNLLQNLYDITHLTLGILLHHLGKLKIQNFCRYTADMEENANKLHFECTDEYLSPVISHGQSFGSAARPLDSRLNQLSQRFLQCGHCAVCCCLAAC